MQFDVFRSKDTRGFANRNRRDFIRFRVNELVEESERPTPFAPEAEQQFHFGKVGKTYKPLEAQHSAVQRVCFLRTLFYKLGKDEKAYGRKYFCAFLRRLSACL